MHKVEPVHLRTFSTYSELDDALCAVLQIQLAEAQFKKANRKIWRDIGWVQHIAISDVLAVIVVIPRDTTVHLWQQTLYQRLLNLLERFYQTSTEVDDSYRDIDSEQLSYYIPTAMAFIRVIAST